MILESLTINLLKFIIFWVTGKGTEISHVEVERTWAGNPQMLYFGPLHPFPVIEHCKIT